MDLRNIVLISSKDLFFDSGIQLNYKATMKISISIFMRDFHKWSYCIIGVGKWQGQIYEFMKMNPIFDENWLLLWAEYVIPGKCLSSF